MSDWTDILPAEADRYRYLLATTGPDEKRRWLYQARKRIKRGDDKLDWSTIVGTKMRPVKDWRLE